jgi:effector-binding domain-containing protein
MAEGEIVIKQVPALKVVSVRGIVPTPTDQARLWVSLRNFVQERGIQPSGAWISVYHDGMDGETGCDVEVCAPISGDVHPDGDVDVREIPAIESAASLVLRGPLEDILVGYALIENWMAENGYRKAARCREVYLREPENDSNSDPETVVEILMPVEKE